jgi:hypothetical protein
MTERMIEVLEDRRLLSAVHVGTHLIRPQNIAGLHFAAAQTQQFSATPSPVQDGLNAIAPAAISATQTVYVHPVSSTTTYYGVVLTSTSGPNTRLVVDENGLPAGNEKVTFGQLSNGPSNDKAIATGLQKLAPSGVTIAASQPVFVRSVRGTTTFSVAFVNSNGTVTRITVDSSGSAVASPVAVPVSPTMTTFAAVPTAVQNGLQALSSTTIATTQTVFVQKIIAGTTLYAITIPGSTTAAASHIVVDQNGLPAGNERVTFGQLQNGPANDKTIATGLQNLAPTGVTIPASQTVFVRTFSGSTTYSVRLTNSNGTETDITVNSSGKLVTFTAPSFTTTTFGMAPRVVQAGLSAIAPSGTTISTSQTVFVVSINSTTTFFTVDLFGGGMFMPFGTRLTVDENGLPATNQRVTFGQLQNGPAADKTVAAGLQNLAPTGVTIPASQIVFVRTFNGATTFTVNLTNMNGTSSVITVDSTGAAVTPPTVIAGGFGDHHGFGDGMFGGGMFDHGVFDHGMSGSGFFLSFGGSGLHLFVHS